MPTYSIVLFLLISLFCWSSCTDTSSNASSLTGKARWIEWGQQETVLFDLEDQSTIDTLLEAIAADIDTARVVVLSEGFHNCEEMLQLQYELIRYLVQEKGFTTITTETGLPESKYVNDYIHGADSIPNFWRKSLEILYSEWKSGRATIEWLRQHNQTASQPVDYIGADIGGFYQDWEFPFEQIFAYLDTVDAPTAQQLRDEMAFYFDIMRPYAAYHYTIKLNRAQKNDLVFLLDDLIETFTINKVAYQKRSSLKDYNWVLQCVKSMRMAEYYYRNYQHIKDTAANKAPIYLGANGREIAMAENIRWIWETQKEAKLIVINHVVHTKTASQYQGDFYQHFTPMGQLLKSHLGDQLFVIGMTYGGGTYWSKWQVPTRRAVDTIPPTDSAGLEQTMAAIASQHHYLGFDHVPLAAYDWFYHPTTIRENDYNIILQPSEWDACIYLHEVHPAVAADTAR